MDKRPRQVVVVAVVVTVVGAASLAVAALAAAHGLDQRRLFSGRENVLLRRLRLQPGRNPRREKEVAGGPSSKQCVPDDACGPPLRFDPPTLVRHVLIGYGY